MSDPDLPPHRAQPARTRVGRALWATLGSLCVGLAALGIALPGLPTTPFLLLAAACFLRSSQRLYDRLLSHRVFGPFLRDVREGRGVPRRAKALALAMMGAAVLFALGPGLPAGDVPLRVGVAAMALVGATVVWRLPTRVEGDAPEAADDGADGPPERAQGQSVNATASVRPVPNGSPRSR